MDFVEPWMIRSAVIVGLLAAANGWLFVLSTKQPPHSTVADARATPASDRKPARLLRPARRVSSEAGHFNGFRLEPGIHSQERLFQQVVARHSRGE